jgi:hypothetical protein
MLGGAESKDRGGADLTHAARSFSTTETDNKIRCGSHLMVTRTSFTHCNLLLSPGLCRVFELEIDRTDETVAGPAGAGFGGLKAPSGMGE